MILRGKRVPQQLTSIIQGKGDNNEEKQTKPAGFY